MWGAAQKVEKRLAGVRGGVRARIRKGKQGGKRLERLQRGFTGVLERERGAQGKSRFPRWSGGEERGWQKSGPTRTKGRSSAIKEDNISNKLGEGETKRSQGLSGRSVRRTGAVLGVSTFLSSQAQGGAEELDANRTKGSKLQKRWERMRSSKPL